MPKESEAKELYRQLAREGVYEEAHFDPVEMKKVVQMVEEDYAFGKRLRELPKPNWRVIFNIHYDVLRELCDQLMRLKRQKCNNHQGVFLFVFLHFPDLELDWPFLEKVRTVRNQNKYKGLDISLKMWKEIELKLDLYIATFQKELNSGVKR